jgi:hypothetical protein
MTTSEVAWPNVVLLAGELYGLGASVSVPAASAGPRAVQTECRQARPLWPCVATGAAGLAWLRASRKAGYKPAFTGHDVVMLRQNNRPKSQIIACK